MSERGSTPTTLAVQQFVGSVGGTALAGIEVAGYGLAARVGAAGLSSGTLTAVTEVLGNGLLHQATDGDIVLTDSRVNAVGAGPDAFCLLRCDWLE